MTSKIAAPWQDAECHERPLVSVILPTHNRARLLERSIQSVLGQTYANLELIVINDASSDDTSEVVHGFKDDRLHYVDLTKNHRAAGARNIGIGIAKGDLFAFQDDDDIWLIQKLEKQVHALLAAGPKVGLNLCGHICIANNGARYIGGEVYFSNIMPQKGYNNLALIATPGWLVKREPLLASGLFDERMKSWDDWELSLRLSELCEVRHLDEPLFIQDRVSGGAMWRDESKFSNDMQIVMQRHAQKWSERPHIVSFHYYLIGRVECTHHSVHEGRLWLLRALKIRPGYLKAWLALATSYLGRGFTSWLTRRTRAVIGAVRATTRANPAG